MSGAYWSSGVARKKAATGHFSAKHFDAVAGALLAARKAIIEDWKQFPHIVTPEKRDDRIRGVNEAMHRMILLFKQDNERFEVLKFIAACTGEYDAFPSR